MNFGQLQKNDNGLLNKIELIKNSNFDYSCSPLIVNRNYFISIIVETLEEIEITISYKTINGKEVIIYNNNITEGLHTIKSAFMPITNSITNININHGNMNIKSCELYEMKNIYEDIIQQINKSDIVITHLGIQGKPNSLLVINGSPIIINSNGIYELNSYIGGENNNFINIFNIGVYSPSFYIIDYRYE